VCALIVGASLGLPLSSAAQTRSLHLVPASPALMKACRSTARAVGYAVPCPTKVPQGLTETGRNGPTPCALHTIGPGGVDGCATSWRGWVVGSSTTADQHLVLVASPRPLSNDARVVNGPAWYASARVRLVARTTINGWQMHAVYVPPDTNDGSAFAHHVVLIWTIGRHTYGFGLHDVSTIAQTLRLDERPPAPYASSDPELGHHYRPLDQPVLVPESGRESPRRHCSPRRVRERCHDLRGIGGADS